MTEPFNVVCPTASADGYGCSAEELICAAVRDHGADIGLVPHDWRDQRFCAPAFLDLEIDRDAIALRRLLVVYFMPYAFAQFRAATVIGQTMFETNRIPDSWAALCERTAGVLVPSRFCRDVFARQVDVPVRAVPLGVNPETYPQADRAGRHGQPFRFLMAGILHYRKGPDLALRAFREEFHPSEPVELILKDRRDFLARALLDVGLNPADALSDPRVRVIGDDYTRQQMAGLYAHADCLVACSRGEGAGLTPREAMSTALPCIVTDWGGLADIADPRYTYPIRAEELEPAPAECSSYGPGVTRGEPIGEFARPSVRELRGAMRHVYEHRDLAYRKGARAADWMRAEWSWTGCARRWLDAIAELAG